MKISILLFCVIFQNFLFSAEQPKNTLLNCRMSLPELQENIVYQFIAEANPLSRSAIIQMVCKQWQHFVLDKNGRIAPLLKKAQQENEDFLSLCEKKWMGILNQIDYSFINSPLFDVRYKSVNKKNRYTTFMPYILDDYNEYWFTKCITKEDVILDDACINQIIWKTNHNCSLDCENKCKNHNVFIKKASILRCLITKRPDMVLKYKEKFFETIIYEGSGYACSLKRILPYLQLHESANVNYYLSCMICKINGFLKDYQHNLTLAQFPTTKRIDQRIKNYIALLINAGVDLKTPVLLESPDGTGTVTMSLAQRFAQAVDERFYPRTKKILQAQVAGSYY